MDPNKIIQGPEQNQPRTPAKSARDTSKISRGPQQNQPGTAADEDKVEEAALLAIILESKPIAKKTRAKTAAGNYQPTPKPIASTILNCWFLLLLVGSLGLPPSPSTSFYTHIYCYIPPPPNCEQIPPRHRGAHIIGLEGER
jgi:hypothetical protein